VERTPPFRKPLHVLFTTALLARRMKIILKFPCSVEPPGAETSVLASVFFIEQFIDRRAANHSFHRHFVAGGPTEPANSRFSFASSVSAGD
jgi:hypothetical protein